MGAVFASFPSTLCQIHIVYVIKRDKQSEEPSLWRRLLCPPTQPKNQYRRRLHDVSYRGMLVLLRRYGDQYLMKCEPGTSSLLPYI